MPVPPTMAKKKLFTDDGKDAGTVVLNWQREPDKEFAFFAEAFHQTAKEAAERLRRNTSFGLNGVPMEDFLAYPVVFLYRHALELYLKAILLEGEPFFHLAGREPISREKLFKTHSLDALRERLEELFELVGPDRATWDFEIDHFRSLDDFRKLIAEFHGIDKGSYAFRYPIDKVGNASLSAHFRFNLFDFCAILDPLFPVLDGIVTGVHEDADAACEAAYEQKRAELEYSDPE